MLMAIVLMAVIAVLLYVVLEHHASPKTAPVPAASSAAMAPQAPLVVPTKPASPYAGQAYTVSTVISGTTCTMNVWTGAAQCTALSGTAASGGACALNKQQATPAAQSLMNIIMPGDR